MDNCCRSTTSQRRFPSPVRFSSPFAVQEVIALAESGRLTPIALEVAPLDRINDVYRRLKQGEIAGRAVIAPAA